MQNTQTRILNLIIIFLFPFVCGIVCLLFPIDYQRTKQFVGELIKKILKIERDQFEIDFGLIETRPPKYTDFCYPFSFCINLKETNLI